MRATSASHLKALSELHQLISELRPDASGPEASSAGALEAAHDPTAHDPAVSGPPQLWHERVRLLECKTETKWLIPTSAGQQVLLQLGEDCRHGRLLSH